MSYAAYASAQTAIETPRDLEIRAISHITRQMIEASRPETNPIDRTRALNGNIRLWSLLMQDLSSPDNALPDAIKARYISLGLFARRSSLRAITNGSDLAALIRINTDVLEALDRQRQSQAA
ncbi:MAG TPA: flagellar biosynthesis regulator FlaF [Rhodopila sp.]|jgi:flagellar protein FlaF|nr:flagellar biosynthesis regulator FlaF [Rhodopila sp.]